MTSLYSYLKSKGVGIQVNFPDQTSQCADYASRINLFKYFGIDYKEKYPRAKSTGRFTEIKEFNDANSYSIYKEIMAILLNKQIDSNMLEVLHFCLWEIIDNTIQHSAPDFDTNPGNGKGYVCAQYFPNRKEIRLMIVDNGVIIGLVHLRFLKSKQICLFSIKKFLEMILRRLIHLKN